MKKKILLLILTIAVMLSFTGTVDASSYFNLSLRGKTTEIEIDETLTFDIVVSNIDSGLAAPGLLVISTGIAFDSNYLEYVSTSAMSGFNWQYIPLSGIPGITFSPPYGGFIFTSSSSITSDTVIGTVTFKVLNIPSTFNTVLSLEGVYGGGASGVAGTGNTLNLNFRSNSSNPEPGTPGSGTSEPPSNQNNDGKVENPQTGLNSPYFFGGIALIGIFTAIVIFRKRNYFEKL